MDSKRSDGVTALIMELVEGPTLAERIDEGAIPVETIAIARQIAEGLEAAHSQGIIHRFSPQTSGVRPDGHVKVLDFGLAKTPTGGPGGFGRVGIADDHASYDDRGRRPACTAAYMSSRECRGAAVDKRSDIWSFGVVLFEMLTGHRAFPETRSPTCSPRC